MFKLRIKHSNIVSHNGQGGDYCSACVDTKQVGFICKFSRSLTGIQRP